jgi:hypothetical protein
MKGRNWRNWKPTLPDPKASGLSRAVRTWLKIPLTRVAAAVERNWTTIGGFETSRSDIARGTERNMLLFYAEKFRERGVPVTIPEDIDLPGLRVILAKALLSAQAGSVTQQAHGVGQALEESGEVDLLERVIETTLLLPTVRADSPGVNARVLGKIKERRDAPQDPEAERRAAMEARKAATQERKRRLEETRSQVLAESREARKRITADARQKLEAAKSAMREQQPMVARNE